MKYLNINGTAKIIRSLLIITSSFNIGCVALKSTTTNLVLDAKFDKYYAFHDVTLVNTEITKELIVNGSLDASNVKLNNITVNGYAELNNSVVYNKFNLNGFVAINKTVLKQILIGNGNIEANNAQLQNIDVATETIVLNDTVVDNIRIQASKSPKITVKNNSVVRGNILFVGGRGVVNIDKTSRVCGSINGADLTKDQVEIQIGSK